MSWTLQNKSDIHFLQNNWLCTCMSKELSDTWNILLIIGHLQQPYKSCFCKWLCKTLTTHKSLYTPARRVHTTSLPYFHWRNLFQSFENLSIRPIIMPYKNLAIKTQSSPNYSKFMKVKKKIIFLVVTKSCFQQAVSNWQKLQYHKKLQQRFN